jgi:DNA-directed RNA polymerase subunit RPC12/RpoP
MDFFDVTDKVKFGENDSEFLPLKKCVCGKEFDFWEKILSIYPDAAVKCRNCGRKLYFKVSIRVFADKP